MSAKNVSDLTIENNLVVIAMSAPESITPLSLGGVLLQDIIDSFWNKIDYPFTLPPRSLTKAALATEIGASSLNDKQWIQITDRADGFPLFVCSQGINKISPYGIWMNTTKPLAVFMDYANGYAGEANPFIGWFDGNRNLNLTNQIIIADASKGAGKVLVSDANGKGIWQGAANGQNSVGNPAAMSGSTMLAMGLGASITPGKSGNVLFSFSGEYTSSTTGAATGINLATGTGTAPLNGASLPAASGYVARKIMSLLASSTTLRIPFAGSVIVTGLTPGVPYWFDLGIVNNASGACQMFNVSLTAIEL